MRALVTVLAVQLLLGSVFIVLSATGNLPFIDADAAGPVSRPDKTKFVSGAAFASVRRQVALGPRPAGSPASRELARRIRRALPDGRFQAVPGGLRNVVGRVPGRDPKRIVVVGAHYDTKDLPGFVGANDGASGVAAMIGIARALRPRELRSTVVFIAFDGEESPRGTPDSLFERRGLRGSKVAARRLRHAKAMILLDFVGEKGLRVPYEDLSDPELWKRLRAASRRAGVPEVFPPGSQGAVSDDHLPFLRQGVPAIDLIDFRFSCFHRRCDDLSRVSERSLDAVGETVLELLPTL